MPGVPAGGNPRAVGTAWLACCAPSGRPLCMYATEKSEPGGKGRRGARALFRIQRASKSA